MLMRRARRDRAQGGRDVGEIASLDAKRWERQRGETRWSGGGAVVGGFPGFAPAGGRLHRAALLLTDRYLIANEGRPDGFALPLAALAGVGAADAPDGDGPAVVARRRGADGDRAFAIVPARGRRGRGDEETGRLLAALEAAGCPIAPPPAPADLTQPWSDLRAAGRENVLWSGDVSAPPRPWAEPRACQAWLSTRSLFWAPRDGAGLCRLPLDALRDVALAMVGDRAPALVVGYRDPGGPRHDLIFRFDRHASPDRALRERGALLVGLRSRGVALGAAPAPEQPWRSAVANIPADPNPAPDGPAAPAPLTVVGGSAAWPPPPPEPGADETRTALVRCRDCEAALLAELARLSAALAAPPAGEDAGRDDAPRLGEALAELDRAAAKGVPAVEVARRRARLLALSEATARLRGLLALRAGGLLAGAALDQRRRAILEPLERHLCA